MLPKREATHNLQPTTNGEELTQNTLTTRELLNAGDLLLHVCCVLLTARLAFTSDPNLHAMHHLRSYPKNCLANPVPLRALLPAHAAWLERSPQHLDVQHHLTHLQSLSLIHISEPTRPY